MKKFLLNLSIKQKVVIISTITIVLISGVGIFACNKLNNETTAVNAKILHLKKKLYQLSKKK